MCNDLQKTICEKKGIADLKFIKGRDEFANWSELIRFLEISNITRSAKHIMMKQLENELFEQLNKSVTQTQYL